METRKILAGTRKDSLAVAGKAEHCVALCAKNSARRARCVVVVEVLVRAVYRLVAYLALRGGVDFVEPLVR
jgi:hypothetical protein